MAVLREPGARYAAPRAQTLGLRALVLAALSIGIMAIDHREQHLSVVRQGLSAAAYPLQVLVHSPLAGWEWLSDTVATRRTLLEENERLREYQRLTDLRLLRLEAIEQENVRLRKLLGAAPPAADRVAHAQIMRLDLDPFRQRVIVDRGTRDGVGKGQPVIDATGVFGQVTNAGPYSAEVILLSDTTHAIPVQISRNGLRTIAVGTGDPHRLNLPYLPRTADVKPGDVLLSSGLGGVFPAGYPVGTVEEVERDPAQPLATVNARPAAALDRANEVLLLWYAPTPVPGEAPAEVAAAPAVGAAVPAAGAAVPAAGAAGASP